jgi:branched-chain amino acid transport system permease protein
VILGGMGKLHGAVLGAFAYVLLQEFLSAPALLGAYAKHWQLAMGSLIVLVVLALPDGLAGLFGHGRSFQRNDSNSASEDLE